MALPLVVLTYTVPVKGGTPARIGAAVAAVPLPLRTFFDLGLYVVSDVTANGPPVTRTITLRINSADPPTATPVVLPGQSASPIVGTNVTHVGSGLIKPPAFLPLDPAGQTLQEWLDGPPAVDSPPGRGCKVAAYMKVVGITTENSGSGYSAATTANLIGGFPQGMGTDVQLPDPLDPLLQPGAPQVFLGSSGVGTRTKDPHTQTAGYMGNVGSVAVLDPGIGYNPATTKIGFLGPTAPGGRPAAGFGVFDAMGRLLSVVMTDPGKFYIKAPEVVARDTTRDTSKFGAKLSADMLRGTPATFGVELGEADSLILTLLDGGDGYVEIPGDGSLVIFDPTGAGVGAKATVGPVIGGTASQFGLSRVDILNPGEAYVDPALSERSYFENFFLVSEAQGAPAKQAAVLRAFGNVLKTAIQNVVLTEVSETVA